MEQTRFPLVFSLIEVKTLDVLYDSGSGETKVERTEIPGLTGNMEGIAEAWPQREYSLALSSSSSTSWLPQVESSNRSSYGTIYSSEQTDHELNPLKL